MSEHDGERTREEAEQEIILMAERIVQLLREKEALRNALKFARKRIAYYGAIGPRRHFDHDMAEVFPKIDAALSLSGETGK